MGSAGFLLIILAFVFLYFVLIRPQKKRQVQSQRMLDELAVGDEVVTAGGIYGEIKELRDEEVLVEIAPALQVRVARRAIAGVLPEEVDEDEVEYEPEAGEDGVSEPGADGPVLAGDGGEQAPPREHGG